MEDHLKIGGPFLMVGHAFLVDKFTYYFYEVDE